MKDITAAPPSAEVESLRKALVERDVEVARLRAENNALRDSLTHACELRHVSHENERQLWAMRTTANYLLKPFTHDAVQEKYKEWPSILEENERLRTEIAMPAFRAAIDRDTAAENELLRARLARVEPVMEAAKAWQASESLPAHWKDCDALRAAIDAALAAEKEQG